MYNYSSMSEADMEDDQIHRLQSWDEYERKVCLQSLALQGEKAARYSGDVAKLLEDENSEVRKNAAVTLGKIGAPARSHLKSLAAALKDEDGAVRAEAARAIGAVGTHQNTQLAEAVASLARDEDEGAQLAAVQCLATLGEAGLLAPFFQSRFAAVCRTTLVEVGRSPEARQKLADPIAKILSHRDTSVRLAAVNTSGELGAACTASNVEALGALRATEVHVKVRRAAAQALGKVGQAGVGGLLLYLKDSDAGVRHFAAETLASVRGAAAAAGAVGLLGDREPHACHAALLALGKMGEDGHAYSEIIADQLSHGDLACRLAAIQALSELGASSQAECLGQLSSDGNMGVRQAAVSALAKMEAEGAAEAVKFLKDEDPAVRQAAVKVYSPLHSKLPADLARPYSEFVACSLLDQDWRVRLAAVVALGDLHAAEYLEQIEALRADADNQVRRSAVTTLVKCGAQAAHVAAFLGDEDRRVREEAQQAYTALGGGQGGGDDSDLSEVE